MTIVGKAVAAPRNSTREETAIQGFVNSNLAPGPLRRQAAPLLESKELLQTIRRLTPENQTKFLEKVDQVCHDSWHYDGLFFPLEILPSPKVYSTLDSRNAKFITALGNACSATGRLPISTTLSVGLEKHGNIAEDSGGATDIWRGEFHGTHVAIKAFRIHPARDLEEAKRVCAQYPSDVRCRTNLQIIWKRVPMWMRLSHENIMPFRGVNTTLFQLALVYDWGQNGNVNQYIASHPGASRQSLVRKTLVTVAAAVNY